MSPIFSCVISIKNKDTYLRSLQLLKHKHKVSVRYFVIISSSDVVKSYVSLTFKDVEETEDEAELKEEEKIKNNINTEVDDGNEVAEEEYEYASDDYIDEGVGEVADVELGLEHKQNNGTRRTAYTVETKLKVIQQVEVTK